jgi:hypothetical protein
MVPLGAMFRVAQNKESVAIAPGTLDLTGARIDPGNADGHGWENLLLAK